MRPIEASIVNPSKNKIIEQVASLKDVKSFVYNRCAQYKDLREDLYQDLLMSLLKIEEVELVGIYQRGELHFKIIGIVKGMLQGNRSTFFNTYIKPRINKVEEKEAHFESASDDVMIDQVLSSIIDIPFVLTEADAGSLVLEEMIDHLKNQSEYGEYDANIIRKYLELGSQTKIHKTYGFNKRYISESIQRSIQNLKNSMSKRVQLPDEIIPAEVQTTNKSSRESKDVIKADKEQHDNNSMLVKKRGERKFKKVCVEKFKSKHKRKI